jgi:hypothetical protein
MSRNTNNALAFIGGLLTSMLLFSCVASDALAEESEEATERVGVLCTHDDGSVTFSIVKLLPASPKEFVHFACIREFNSPEVRCYAVHNETFEVRWLDLKITD